MALKLFRSRSTKTAWQFEVRSAEGEVLATVGTVSKAERFLTKQRLVGATVVPVKAMVYPSQTEDKPRRRIKTRAKGKQSVKTDSEEVPSEAPAYDSVRLNVGELKRRLGPLTAIDNVVPVFMDNYTVSDGIKMLMADGPSPIFPDPGEGSDDRRFMGIEAKDLRKILQNLPPEEWRWVTVTFRGKTFDFAIDGVKTMCVGAVSFERWGNIRKNLLDLYRYDEPRFTVRSIPEWRKALTIAKRHSDLVTLEVRRWISDDRDMGHWVFMTVRDNDGKVAFEEQLGRYPGGEDRTVTYQVEQLSKFLELAKSSSNITFVFDNDYPLLMQFQRAGTYYRAYLAPVIGGV